MPRTLATVARPLRRFSAAYADLHPILAAVAETPEASDLFLESPALDGQSYE